MAEAKLQLTIPDRKWVSDLSQSYPDATFRILSAIPNENSGVALAEITSSSLASLLSEIGSYDDIEETNVLNETGETALVQFETSLPLLLLAARESGTPLAMPFEIQNGQATWEIQTSRERLSSLADQLDERGIHYSIEYVQPDIENEQLLTEKQRRLIQTAIENGYYNTPRECSLEDIAEQLELATSTVGETLQRAESKIITNYANATWDE